MNINDAYPSNYLSAGDLKGAQPVVTIDRVEVEPIGRGKEMKPVLYFAGKDKGMVLNKTNSKSISTLAGTAETDEWAGLRIRLYSAQVEFQGEMVNAIRVKAAPPNGNGATPPPPPTPPPAHLTDEDIPF